MMAGNFLLNHNLAASTTRNGLWERDPVCILPAVYIASCKSLGLNSNRHPEGLISQAVDGVGDGRGLSEIEIHD